MYCYWGGDVHISMITVFLLSTICELYKSKKFMGELGRADQWKKGPTVSLRHTRKRGSNFSFEKAVKWNL